MCFEQWLRTHKGEDIEGGTGSCALYNLYAFALDHSAYSDGPTRVTHKVY
jgi:hypothetical protein